jgi:hypothetical protein
MLPVFPLVNIREAEFPVLVELINAFEESLPLFGLRQVKEDLDDPGAVPMEVILQVHYGTIPLLLNRLFVAQFFRKPLAAQNLRMHPNNQHFLVI